MHIVVENEEAVFKPMSKVVEFAFFTTTFIPFSVTRLMDRALKLIGVAFVPKAKKSSPDGIQDYFRFAPKRQTVGTP